jgi:hypothetical protein
LQLQHGVLHCATSFLSATQQRPRPRRAADRCARAGAGGRTAQCTGGRRGRCRGRGRRGRVCLWAVRLAAAAPPVAWAPRGAHRAAVGEWRRRTGCARAVAHVTLCGVHWATGAVGFSSAAGRRRVLHLYRHNGQTKAASVRHDFVGLTRIECAATSEFRTTAAIPRQYRGNTAAFRRIDPIGTDRFGHSALPRARHVRRTYAHARQCARPSSAFRMQRTTHALHAWTALAATLGTPRAALASGYSTGSLKHAR